MADSVRLRITVEDIDTGETQTAEIEKDFVLICAHPVYLAHTTKHANGTTTLTVKRGDRD